MDNSSTFPPRKCMTTSTGNFVITITAVTLPFHILMIKVLISDLRLSLPRHYTMLCLSVSDALQIFITFLCATAMQVFSLTAQSTGCYVARTVQYFNLAMTLVASSLSLIALSAERYVACIHSFHLHRIFTRERILYGTLGIWILSIICGILTATNWLDVILDGNQFIKILSVIFINPTCIILSVVQIKLFLFSRKKLARVRPESMFGSEAEIDELRKKQIKVAFVASIVAIAYIVCMLPIGCLSLYELIHGNISSNWIKGLLEGLVLVNNLMDPYIYGFGVADARKAVFKNLKRIKNAFMRQS